MLFTVNYQNFLSTTSKTTHFSSNMVVIRTGRPINSGHGEIMLPDTMTSEYASCKLITYTIFRTFEEEQVWLVKERV